MALRRRDALILGGVAVAAAVAGGVVGALALQARSGAADLLASTYPDLSGRPRRLLDWQGQVLVCNFWATWCAPCREEIPLLVAAKQQYGPKGLEIVGIGLDSVDKIAEFRQSYKINYPILLADFSAIGLMRKLGNSAGGLPFTVVLDRSGTLAHRKLGAISRDELQEVLEGLLR